MDGRELGELPVPSMRKDKETCSQLGYCHSLLSTDRRASGDCELSSSDNLRLGVIVLKKKTQFSLLSQILAYLVSSSELLGEKKETRLRHTNGLNLSDDRPVLLRRSIFYSS